MPQGVWEELIEDWPSSEPEHRAIHLVLVYHSDTWKVLAVGMGEGTRDAMNTVCHLYHADDLENNGSTMVTVTCEGTDLFCAGHCHMENGDVFFAGGAFIPGTYVPTADANVLDLTEGTPKFRRLRPMHHARWYPTCTMLMEGRILITSGLRATLDHRWPPDATAPRVSPCHSHCRTEGVAA